MTLPETGSDYARVIVLHIHRATRADVLASALAELLAEPAGDPFSPEVVAVPTRGMERWLTQTMSGVLGAGAARDGICANVVFPTPHRLLSDAVAAASGVDPETDPWLPERLTWRLLEVVDACLGEPWLRPLAAYLGATRTPTDPLRAERRLAIVGHLAVLLDRYALHRPAMLAAWAQGRDEDAAGQPLPPSGRWQPPLWRALRERVGVPGPAERRARACERLLADPGLLELPERISLFGLTRLPAGHLEVLRALAAGRELHLHLLHPSPAAWRTLALAGTDAVPPELRRAREDGAGRIANRLLASWGRDAREMQLVLAASAQDDDRDVEHPLPPEREGEPAAPSLLARMQDDVRADRPAPGAPLGAEPDRRALLEPGDESLVVHACHGRVRQVEVLRDAILHALAADPTLEPRDVIVMCPDIEAFAPLIQATFHGPELEDAVVGGPRVDPHRIDLRIRLADRSLTQTNPVLSAVAAVFELVGRRISASQVLDLADRGPVRRRFGFDDDDLAQLQEWIAMSGIRWGLDAEHRAPYKLSAIPEATWRAGLDRLLLGVTMTEQDRRRFAGVLPLDDVDSRAIELAGRLAELTDRLQATLDELGHTRPLAEWARALGRAADALTRTGGRDGWQRAELSRILEEMVSEDTTSGGSELTPAEARLHLAARLAGRPTRANFRTGHLTVCTLMPMRSVPHRMVCLLGLDDGAFPRRGARDGDDLLLADPRLGERDPRSEDRQLLLDALLAARERLLVTYTGNDERTNVVCPPAVPVGELLDAVDATVTLPGGDQPARRRIVRHHPLQPFDPQNFATSADGTAQQPWSFDPVALAGARALLAPRRPRPPFLDAPLPEPGGDQIELEDLVSFVSHPARAFLRGRLRISVRERDDEVSDAIPIELSGLDRYGVGDRLLAAELAGVDRRVAVAAERGRGLLPPGALGDRELDAIMPTVRELVRATATLAPKARREDPVEVRVGLAGGLRLSGTIAGLAGEVLITAMYARLGPKHRLAAWVRFLALTAAWPEREFAAATLGRASGPEEISVSELVPFAGDPSQRRDRALAELETLVDVYRRGMREPLPIFCATSAAWAQAARAGTDPQAPAQQEWHADRGYEREDGEPEHRLVLGGRRSLAELLEPAPAPDEAGPGWPEVEPTRFGRYARRLWDGLLEHERVWSR